MKKLLSILGTVVIIAFVLAVLPSPLTSQMGKERSLLAKRLVVDDSLRTTVFTANGASTFGAATTFSATSTFNALANVQQLGYTASTTKSFAGAAGATDTLALASAAYSYIKIRNNAATDSLEHITGGVSGVIYIFQAVADDSTTCLVDGQNLKLGGNRNLDALTDRLVCYFDGTNFIELYFASND